MRKYLVLYEDWGAHYSHIWFCNQSRLNFLIDEENFVLFFISAAFDYTAVDLCMSDSGASFFFEQQHSVNISHLKMGGVKTNYPIIIFNTFWSQLDWRRKSTPDVAFYIHQLIWAHPILMLYAFSLFKRSRSDFYIYIKYVIPSIKYPSVNR